MRVAVLIVLIAAACEPGGVYESPGTAPPAADAPDADPSAPDADPTAPDAATAAPPPATDCVDAVPTGQSGEHNAGQPCMVCHGAGGEGPTFTMGGTLYTSAAGTSPLSGATIRVSDANGATIDMISAQNGNFWTTQAIAYPVTVLATRCPDTAPMISQVAAPGDCNSAGCHSAGAPSGRIHLP